EARHDEGAVGHAVDLFDARADGRTEHDEVKRGRDDGRDHALQDRALHARHLEQVDRPDRTEVHCFSLTRLTKISSSERWRVLRSLTLMPESLRSASSDVIPVRAACES